MKIRNGFVSNSSSSSFIIHKGNISVIARSMFKTIIREFSEQDKYEGVSNKKRYQRWLNNLKIALNMDTVRDGKIGITMPSCNYDTYIFYYDGSVYVLTCSNYSWDIDGIAGVGEDDDKDIVKIESDKLNFFNIRNKLTHSKPKYIYGEESAYCSYCRDNVFEYVEHKGRRLCASCYKGKIGLTPEEKEIKKIESLAKEHHINVNPIKFLEP